MLQATFWAYGNGFSPYFIYLFVNTTFIHQEQVTSNKTEGWDTPNKNLYSRAYHKNEGMGVFSISEELKMSRPYQPWTKPRICPNKLD
jgi:hypothetical protein